MPRPSSRRRLALRIERQFRAPVKRVWKAWTNRTDMAKWFGEGPESAQVYELDARPGGRLRVRFPSSSRSDRVGNYFGLFISVPASRELVLSLSTFPADGQRPLG